MRYKTRNWLSCAIVFVMVVGVVILGGMLTQARQYYEDANARALLWRDVIDGVPGGIVVVDYEGCVIAWSVGAEHLLGWLESDVVGANITFLMPSATSRAAHASAIADVERVDRLMSGEVIQYSCYALTKYGQVKHVRVRITGIHDGYKFFLAHIDLEEQMAPVVAATPLDVIDPSPIQQQLRKKF